MEKDWKYSRREREAEVGSALGVRQGRAGKESEAHGKQVLSE